MPPESRQGRSDTSAAPPSGADLPSRALLLLIPLATFLLFLWGTDRQFDRNTDIDRTDQRNYIACARESRVKPFGRLATRNYMPLFPRIMSVFYREGMSDEQFMQVGKRVNIIIALLAAAVLYAVLLWRNHPTDAVIAASAATLSMLAFKAPCFQPEVLFLMFALLMFVAQVRLILAPSWSKAVLAGP